MSPLPRFIAVLAIAAAAAGGRCAAQSLEGRPLRTESPQTLAFGRHALELGSDWTSDATPQPLLSARRGDLRRAVVRWRAGLGRAELAIGGALWQDFDLTHDDLRAPRFADDGEVGDASLRLKVLALKQRESRPSLGVAVETKLPNASDETGLGTDETDVLVQFLLGHAWQRSDLRVNLGLAILGDPRAQASQEDLLTFGIGGQVGGRHALLWEATGRTLSEDPRDLDQSVARLGYLRSGGAMSWDASVHFGLTDSSGDLGVSTGLTWLLGRERTP